MPHADKQAILAELNRLERRHRANAGSLRRKFPRFIVRGDAELQPMDRTRLDHRPIEIALRDVARSGMGFLCGQPLEIGSTWRCGFLNQGHVFGHQAVIIRHCEAVNHDLFLIGGQFIIDTGLLLALGVDASALTQIEPQPDARPSGSFLPPGAVA